MTGNDSPCLVISSARSGSKLLRALLMESGAFNCYPYDINYIWMRSFSDRDNDELELSDVRPGDVEFIRRYFDKLLKDRSNSGNRVLEKTVSNGLRLEYVCKTLPGAQVIHLVRDGRDVTASIQSCWKTTRYSSKNQDKKLMFQKLMNFPFFHSTPYLIKYLKNSVSGLSGKASLGSWGPRYSGMEDMMRENTLVEVCATQWARSIDRTRNGLHSGSIVEPYLEVKYEELVSNSEVTIERIASFLNLNNVKDMISWGESNITSSTSGWANLSEEEQQLVWPIIEKNMRIYGYV